MTIDQKRGRSENLVHLSGLVYGLNLRGELPQEFRAYLHSSAEQIAGGERAIDVRYRVVRELPEVDEIWVGERRPPQRNSRLALFRQPDGFGLRVDCEGRGLFRVTASAIEVEWLPDGAGAAHYFFSYALPLWLESRGMPVLHASAVSFGDRAVGFLGPSGIGKSTLCVGLVSTGCDLVADDGLVLRVDGHGDWRCLQGPPLARLWPSALEDHFGVSAKELPRVYQSFEKRLMACTPKSVAKTAAGLTLATVYMLDRKAESKGYVTISACSARESLVRLLEHSLTGAPVAALGLSAQRLDQLSRVVSQIPVKTLRYPSGGDRWHLLREAILEDLAGPSHQRS
ncbi:MAG: hypothetical protein IH936_04315 [Acidobacteria bacterium]|nr:hypothetical protein [Acidobacteriota bacterium]